MSDGINRPSPTAAPGTTVTVSGPIIDPKTGAAVTADVYVAGKLLQKGVTAVAVTIPLYADRRIELRVEAAGYQPWALSIRGGGTDKRMEGSVRIVSVEPTAGPKM
jgi:hypothetical protein